MKIAGIGIYSGIYGGFEVDEIHHKAFRQVLQFD